MHDARRRPLGALRQSGMGTPDVLSRLITAVPLTTGPGTASPRTCIAWSERRESGVVAD